MITLELLSDGGVQHSHPVGAQPVHIGRATTNELVLSDPKVSGRHLVVWTDSGRVWVEDLGSRNGTAIDGETLKGRKAVSPGCTIVLGERIHLRISGEAPSGLEARALVLCDPKSGVRMPLRTDRVTFGSDPASDWVIQGPARSAVLLVHADEVWLGTDDDTVELAVDTPFEVAGVTLVLKPDPGELTRTEGLDQARYPYALEVSLNGATLTDLASGRTHQITSEVRASLLYVLARAWLSEADKAPVDRGWMLDDDVASGIWGRTRHGQQPNNYHVLVHRIRKDVSEGGLDPWFLEKKRKHLRLRLDQVTMA